MNTLKRKRTQPEVGSLALFLRPLDAHDSPGLGGEDLEEAGTFVYAIFEHKS
jgi:hypothetical protein